METYLVQLKMEKEIWDKLLSLQATSEERAVTIEEAKLDPQEQNWLPYVAGGFLAKIKKTKDKRYYVRIQ